ncbi:hypothetical protein A3715_03715 [Oleiphilus sp. HI0009]|nr:hypothetical protein A3715_03715 [Oleiphilus sp. HI0009]
MPPLHAVLGTKRTRIDYQVASIYAVTPVQLARFITHSFLNVDERIECANDLVNNITERQSEHGNYVWEYDSLNRLINADYPDETSLTDYLIDEAFVYDGVGNRTDYTQGSGDSTITQTWDYTGTNQLSEITDSNTPENNTTFAYNANGHTIQKNDNAGAANETHTYYIYNAEERLIRLVDTNNATIASYTYNPMGHRVSKTLNSQTTNSSTTYYLYNHQGLVGEYNSAGALIKEYHYMPDRTWMTEPLFQRVAQGANSQIYYYQNDHLGTPQRMINQSGATVWQANYNSFGQAHTQTNTVENNLRFPGQYYDAESGLHQNYFRDYDPELGRYIQSDPIGLAGGLNTYGYAYQSPLVWVDPTGEFGVGAAVGAACAAATLDGDETFGQAFCKIAFGAVSGALGPLGSFIADQVSPQVCGDDSDNALCEAAKAAANSASSQYGEKRGKPVGDFGGRVGGGYAAKRARNSLDAAGKVQGGPNRDPNVAKRNRHYHSSNAKDWAAKARKGARAGNTVGGGILGCAAGALATAVVSGF